MHLIIIVLTAILFSCSSNESEPNDVEFIGGKKHIHNNAALWGDEPEVELKFVRKIGDLDGLDENYWLHQPRDLAVDKAGNVYIVDQSNHRIQKYSPDGKYISTIGREGEGPGEFIFPNSIDISNDDILYVNDSNNLRVVRLTTDGSVINIFKNGIRNNVIRLFSDGNFAGRSTGSGSNIQGADSLCMVFDNNGKIVKEIGLPVDWEDDRANLLLNLFHVEVDNKNNVCLSFINQNRIDKYSYTGEHIFTSTRPLKFKPVDKVVYIEVGPGRKTGKQGRDVLTIPVTNGISVDYKERIWVPTANMDFTKTDTNEYLSKSGDKAPLMDFHIFNSEGIFLGSLPMPVMNRFFTLRIFGSRLFLIDYSDDTCVLEYEIVDN
ncbi:NHL repeat-containing protein [candidate division KSB1 bacterium]